MGSASARRKSSGDVQIIPLRRSVSEELFGVSSTALNRHNAPESPQPTGEYEAAHVVDSTTLSIRNVLRSKAGNFYALLEYARQTYNEDMVMFWALADTYASKWDATPAARRRMAEHMTRCYLRVGADRELNVSARLRRRVLEEMDGDPTKELPVTLFAEVQKEMEALMDKNLNGFLDDKRDFWKRQVAWDQKSGGRKTSAAEGEGKGDPEELLTVAAGGDALLKSRLIASGSLVQSVNDIAELIMSPDTA